MTPLRRAVAALVLLIAGACAVAQPVETNPTEQTPKRINAGNPNSPEPATVVATPRFDIALVTVQPGEIYWERFGHNGLLFRERATGRVTLYHYGIFDFTEKNFLWNFIRGYMTYLMVAVDPTRELEAYKADGRGVRLQWLSLDAAQEARLFRFLQWNAQPENAPYRYNYFTDNCSTRVRDALDRVLDGSLRGATDSRSRGATYRMHALRLTAPDKPLALGISVGLGPFADRPLTFWEESFVPAELARNVGELRIDDGQGGTRPLVQRDEMLVRPLLADPPAAAPTWYLASALVGVALGLLLAMLGRREGVARRVFGVLSLIVWLTATLGGALLLFLWWGTEHVSAWRNANVLLLNPLCLLLLPASWRALRGRVPGSRFTRSMAAIVLGCVFVALSLRLTAVTPQAIYAWILVWLPIHLGAWVALRDDTTASAQ